MICILSLMECYGRIISFPQHNFNSTYDKMIFSLELHQPVRLNAISSAFPEFVLESTFHTIEIEYCISKRNLSPSFKLEPGLDYRISGIVAKVESKWQNQGSKEIIFMALEIRMDINPFFS